MNAIEPAIQFASHPAILGFTFVIALLVLCLVVLLLVLYKVRKIHLASYRLLEDAATTRREAGALFAQLQALWALERKLALPEALPPMRGWAGSPDFLLAVADEALRSKPSTVMECSSGVSTVVIARCLQLNGAGHVYSLEHAAEYAHKTRAMLAKYGLADWATVIDAPLVTVHTEVPWYDETAIPPDLPGIDLLVIDGPPGYLAPLARYPALPRLRSRLSDTCMLFVDDADRLYETEMLKRWKTEFPDFEQTHVPFEKGMAILRRRDGSE